ncbi:MAG: hypothetical protein HRT88_19640 [Lentisphaeraceae bacterium]|nr:hypothetical protein [Lentisphaeraceae bacterium]
MQQKVNYFRAFQVAGQKHIEVYHKAITELSQAQQKLFSCMAENKDAQTAQEKVNQLNDEMLKKYNMVPDLFYHAMPEKGFVSTLIPEVEYKKLIADGKLKEGEGRQVEIQKGDIRDTAFTIPVLNIQEPHAFQKFEKILSDWQILKAQIVQAKADNNTALTESLTDQFDASCKEMNEKYKLNPKQPYILETTVLGVYMTCTDEHLTTLAGIQKGERMEQFQDYLKNRKNS